MHGDPHFVCGSAYVHSGGVPQFLWVCAPVQHGQLLSRPCGVPLRDGVCISVAGRFFTGLVRVFIELAYWLTLKYARTPDPSGSRGEMAMARASSLASPWPGCTLRTVPSVHETFQV